MSVFPLRIGTPDGMFFNEDVERVVVRTITGDRAILANHIDFCTGIGMGEAHVVLPGGEIRKAACIGGMLAMNHGICRILSTTWEWKEDIDSERARKAKEKAEKILREKNLEERERRLAEARLKRALVRLSVGEE